MDNSFDMDFDLDMAGALAATDKASSYSFAWDYLRHYEELFRPWRDSPINVLEIGVAEGASLRLWQSYFRAATIVGVDINRGCAQHAGGRVVVEIGSQVDPGFLHRVTAKYPPTIIIDDGSHMAEHILYSFERLFPTLQPGGIYIVEDVAFHFQPATAHLLWPDGPAVPDYFLSLARSCLAKTMPEGTKGATPTYVFEQTDSVVFFHSAVVIQKKQPREISRAIRFAETALSDGPATGHQYGRVAEYLLRHDGPLERAEQMARRAAELTGYAPEFAELLSRALLKAGRVDEAVEVLRHAVSIHANDEMLWDRLGNAERRRGNHAAAIAAFRRVVSLRPNAPWGFNGLSHALEQAGEIAEALSVAERAAELERDRPAQKAFLERVEHLRSRLPR